LLSVALLLPIKKFPALKRYAEELGPALFMGVILNTRHTSACLLAVAVLLAGCGGGGGSTAQGTCALGASSGCGGSLPADPPATPGGPGTSNPPPDPAASVGAVDLVASSGELGSAGIAGTEVTVTALVKTSGNVAVSGAPVQFTADSGFLAVVTGTSDANGKASARLGTGGSKANRAIKVTATVGGKTASTVVNVTGTHLLFNVPAAMAIGDSSTATATLLDSANQPIAGQAIAASARNGNTVRVGAAASDSRGQVTVQIAATTRASEEITLSALGASITRQVAVTGTDISMSPSVTLDASGNQVLKEVQVGSCAPVDGSTTLGATSVSLSASRGTLYRDAGCSQPLSGALPVAGGAFATAYIRSDNAGVTTIEAALSNGARGSTSLEFVAPLAPTSHVTLQADQAVLGSGERSTLIAVVRDGTMANNLVKGATVQFSIIADSSGGNLLAPFSAVTGSDGVARAVFVGGAADSGKDGTLIQARITDLAYATTAIALTVNKKALSIQFGTGNSLVEYSPTVFQQDFTVFVSDSAGNPVKDVVVTASAWATAYIKGRFMWQDDVKHPGIGLWVHEVEWSCPNEDIFRKGLFDYALDVNGNNRLDPGIPLSVTGGGKTDAMGMAVVSLRYPRDRATWINAELTVTGVVAGTEATARFNETLPALAKDLFNREGMPPGYNSPYGIVPNCLNTN
jgi:hypothetical protein